MKTATFAVLALLTIAATASADVLRVELNDAIHPISEEFVVRALDQAALRKSDAVLIELRTPGGLDVSMRNMIEKIIKSPVPVIVWVGPSGARAASAGFFILESADVAAMAPGTNTGAAHPVALGQKVDDIMKMKMQNDAAAYMRTLTQRRGRNVKVAESGVREAKSFTEDEALAQHLIEVIAADVPSLLRWADGKTVKRFDGKTTVLHVANKPLTNFKMTLRQRVLSKVLDPNIAFLLMTVGLLALYAEFNHPGAILPGVVGLIAISLAVLALNILPTSLAAVGMILIAFALFALEAKFTSYGALGAGGVFCLIMGGMLLVDGPIPEMRVHLWTAVAVSIPIGLIAVFLMTLVIRAYKNRVATGTEGMIGEIGVARTAVNAEGKVFVHGELWNATARTSIAEGARVRVRGVDGLKVMVEPAD